MVETFESLRNLFQSEDRYDRMRAIKSISKSNDSESTDFLIQALDDCDYEVRETVAKLLQEKNWVPSNQYEKALFLIALREWSDDLVKLGDDAVEYLSKFLDDKYLYTRRGCVVALGEIDSKRSCDALVKTNKDDDLKIQQNALNAINESTAENSITSLVKFLESSERSIREQALSMLKSKNWMPTSEYEYSFYYLALKEVDELLNLGFEGVNALIVAFKDKSDEMSWLVSEALENISNLELVEQLISNIHSTDEYLRKVSIKILRKIKSPEVSQTFFEGLRIQDFEIKRFLVNMIDEQQWITDNSESNTYYYLIKESWAEIAKIGKDAVQPLLNSMDCSDNEMLVRIIEIIGDLGENLALPKLIENLDNSDSLIRAKIAESLGKINDSSSVVHLRKLLEDRDGGVRRKAAESLEILKWKPENATSQACYYIAVQNWQSLLELSAEVEDIITENLLKGSTSIRRGIARMLGKSANTKYIEPLTQSLKDKDIWVCQNAHISLQTLQSLNDDSSQSEDLRVSSDGVRKVDQVSSEVTKSQINDSLLNDLLDNDIQIRHLAIEQLTLKKSDLLVKTLTETLKNEDFEKRIYALSALESIGWKCTKEDECILVHIAGRKWNKLPDYGHKATLPLIVLLKSSNINVRRRSAEILGIICDSSSKEALLEALADPDVWVRNLADRALENINK